MLCQHGLRARIVYELNEESILGGSEEFYIEEKNIEGYHYGFGIFQSPMKDGYTASCSPPGAGQLGFDQEIPNSLEMNVNWIISKYKDFIK